MGSKFEIFFSNYFIEQWKVVDEKGKSLLNSKFSLISHNPFRYRSHKGYKNVFKVKLSLENKYSRLMYATFLPNKRSVSILGIFPRDLEYKDFERVFGYLRKR